MRRLATALAVAGLVVCAVARADVWTVDSGGSGDYLTIQAAIDAVTTLNGDTINVAAGTYNERLNVSKSLTLLGAQTGVDPTASGVRTTPALESVVTEAGLSTPNPDVLVEIPSGVTNVIIDGFTLSGDLTNATADTSTIRCWDDDLTISNNIVDGWHGVLYKGNDYLTVDQNRLTINKGGVIVQPSAASNVVVSGNTFALGASPATDAQGVYMTGVIGAEVSGNRFEGFPNAGIKGSNLTDIEVTGNTIVNSKDGVSFWGTTTLVDISENDIYGSTRYGISIKGQDITIDCNRIANSGDIGVNIDKNVLETERVSLAGNNIMGNTNYGVYADTDVTMTVTAEDNWWGAADGPSGIGSGSGDAVGGNVDYDPFLTEPSPCAPPVPEPGVVGLLGLGVLGLVRRTRRS